MEGPVSTPRNHHEGWELASISGGDHLVRIVEMYREMGFEVYVEEVRAEECPECNQCFKNGGPVFRVFKRRKA
ncbi:MAG: hypothetical protein N3E40_00945 [Dehalococcoidia bacterium]|nr:hypothetical protein [Dehalococcoidia bacterium]